MASVRRRHARRAHRRARRARRRPRPLHAQLARDRAATRPSATGAAPTPSCRGCAAQASARSSSIWGTPRWANRGRGSELGAGLRASIVRGVRRRSRQALPVGEEVGDLERAEPAPLAAPDDRRDLRQQAAEPGVRRDPPRDAAAPWWPEASRRRAASSGGVVPGRLHPRHARARAPGSTRTRTIRIRSTARRRRSPGGCAHCETIAMAALNPLLIDPPGQPGLPNPHLADRVRLGDQPARPGAPACRGRGRRPGRPRRRGPPCLQHPPRVDMLIHYLFRDEPGRAALAERPRRSSPARAKPALRAYQLPLVQASRTGSRTILWGQVRPGKGRQRYVLQQHSDGSLGRRRRHAAHELARLPLARGARRSRCQVQAAAARRRPRQPDARRRLAAPRLRSARH